MAKDTDITIDPSLMRMARTLKVGGEGALVDIGDRVQTAAKGNDIATFTDRTGQLRTSILRLPVDTQEMSVTIAATVGDPDDRSGKNPAYGKFINDGTKNKDGSQRIKPIKFLEKGVKKVEPQMERIIVKHLDRTM